MRVLGLSSLDSFISLLLIETAWWGKAFLENTLYHFLHGSIDIDITTVAYALVILLKFICQGIAWYALLHRQAEKPNHGILLKSWFCMSNGLDLTMISWIVTVNALNGGYCAVLPRASYSVLVLGWVWIIGYRLVVDISSEEKALFSEGFRSYFTDRSRIQATVTILFVWEFAFYALSFAGTVVSRFYHWSILLPYDEQPGSLLTTVLLVKPVIVALFQLIGIRQNWNGFLKCWFSVYILFNVLGYILTNSGKIYLSFQYMNSASDWIIFGINLTLTLCALMLKFGIVFGTFIYLFKSDEASLQKEDTEEDRPLITRK